MSFKDILAGLQRYSLRTILIEGGGETIASAIESGCVDDLIIFIAPKIIGGSRAPGMVGGPGIARMRDAIKAGRRFQVGDTEITPDLLPAQWKLKPPGLPPWP